MLAEILKKISTPRTNRKAGFTIIELMVVIIIVNLLSGVAVPKLTDYIERTRQKIDLLKLYDLRDGLNRALYEGDILNIDESATCSGRQNSKGNLSKWLASKDGVTLFIIELHDILPANFQPDNKNRISDNQNMCGLLTSDGFWSQALRDAGFDAVANILIDRQTGKYKKDNNIPVTVSNREQEIIDRLKTKVDDRFKDDIDDLYKTIFDLSKRLQNKEK